MTITLNIPDETWQAVERMASRQNMTPVERLEKLIEIAHEIEVKQPYEERAAKRDQMVREQGGDPDAPTDLTWLLAQNAKV